MDVLGEDLHLKTAKELAGPAHAKHPGFQKQNAISGLKFRGKENIKISLYHKVQIQLRNARRLVTEAERGALS